MDVDNLTRHKIKFAPLLGHLKDSTNINLVIYSNEETLLRKDVGRS